MCSCVLVFWCILCCWMAVVRAVNERVWHYDQNIVQIFNQNRGEQQQKNAGKTSTKIIMDACKQTYLCVPYICFTVSICCAAVAAFSHIYHHMPFPLSSVNIWIHQKKIVFFCANWNETTRNETICQWISHGKVNENEKTDPIGKIAFHRSICVNSTRCDFFRIVGYFFFHQHRVGESRKMFSTKLDHFISTMTKFTDFALVRWVHACVWV